MPDGGILDRIVARKRADLASRLAGLRLEELRAWAEPTDRSLRAALSAPGARFILEVKRASPSQGRLRERVDPAAIARGYAGVADAVSVLTDTPYFGGSLDDLLAVRRAFSGPVLAKDFILDPRQVVEARLHGADAVLAMLSILDDDEARQVLAEAGRLGMDVLVEAHDEKEVRRAVGLGAPIVGINNRCLRTMRVDLATTERLAHLVPPDRILVAESGISGRAEVERLSRHADAFLVGSSLMRAEDPGLAARALVAGRVKVCGLTNVEDAASAERHGASFAGLVMVPGTPRALTPARAEPIARSCSIPVVGVFRNAKVIETASLARRLGLHAVQLHGEEDSSYVKALGNLLPEGTEIWAAAAVGRSVPEPRPGADRTLFDTQVQGRCGGTGRTFEWSRVRDRPDLPAGILAGGLAPANAAAAGRLGAYALDVGSGVEARPGRKDDSRLRAFFEALRPPSRREAAPC